jgi:hypothetical protein
VGSSANAAQGQPNDYDNSGAYLTINNADMLFCVLPTFHSLQAAHHCWRGGQQHNAAQGQPHRL